MTTLVKNTVDFAIDPLEWQAKYSLDDGSAGVVKKGALFVASRMETLPLILFCTAQTAYMVANAAFQTFRVSCQAIAILILKATFHEISERRKEVITADFNDIFRSAIKAVGFVATTPLLLPLSLLVPSACPHVMESMGLYKAPTLHLLDKFERIRLRAESLIDPSEAPHLLRELESIKLNIKSLEVDRVLQKGSYEYVRNLLLVSTDGGGSGGGGGLSGGRPRPPQLRGRTRPLKTRDVRPPRPYSAPPKPRAEQRLAIPRAASAEVLAEVAAPDALPATPRAEEPTVLPDAQPAKAPPVAEAAGTVDQVVRREHAFEDRTPSALVTRDDLSTRSVVRETRALPRSSSVDRLRRGNVCSFQIEQLKKSIQKIQNQLDGEIARESISEPKLNACKNSLKLPCGFYLQFVDTLSEVYEFTGEIPQELQSKLDLGWYWLIDDAREKFFKRRSVGENEPVFKIKEQLRDVLRKMTSIVDSIQPITELPEIERTLKRVERGLQSDLRYFQKRQRAFKDRAKDYSKKESEKDAARLRLASSSATSTYNNCFKGKSILAKRFAGYRERIRTEFAKVESLFNALQEHRKVESPKVERPDEEEKRLEAVERGRFFEGRAVENPTNQPPLKDELKKLSDYLYELIVRFEERKKYFISQPTCYTTEERDEEECILRNVEYSIHRIKAQICKGELTCVSTDYAKLSEVIKLAEDLKVTCDEIIEPTWTETVVNWIYWGFQWVGSWFMAQDHEWKMQKYCISLQEQTRHLEKLDCDLVDKKAAIEKLPRRSPVDECAIRYLDYLIRGAGDKTKARYYYYQALYQMRYALEDADFARNTGLSGELFRAAAYVRYTQNQLYTFSESVVDLWLNTGRKLNKDYSRLEHVIQERDAEDIGRTKAVLGADKVAVERGKLQGTINVNFDPNTQSNVPYVLADVDMCDEAGTSVRRRMLRMGTPTREGAVYSAEVIPEFRAYLQEAQKKGEGHLYVSLQSHRPKDLGKPGDETKRTEAIKALQGEFRETFTFVVFAQDTEFYEHPLGEGEKSYEEFRKKFKLEMLGDPNETGFYFPESWKTEAGFKTLLDEVIAQVHQLVFKGRKSLTLEERQDFLEITYAMLIPRLAAKAGAERLNVTCKDAIDRAAKLNCLTLKLAQIMQGKGADRASRKKLQKVTYAPAIFTKKQAIIGSRRRRMLSALAWLNKPEVIGRIREAAQVGNFGIDASSTNGVHFEEVPSQVIDFRAQS